MDPSALSVLQDPARLAALAAMGPLEGHADPVLDRWVGQALIATGAPSGQLTLVDGSGAITRARGDGSPTTRVPTDRSLCREVVVRGEPVIVERALADGRVAGYGVVTGGTVGAYAGFPVRSAEGHVVGAFCVTAPEPRRWSSADVVALEALAAATEAELRLRAATDDLAHARALMGAHRRAHELMMGGAPLGRVLDELVRGVQDRRPGLRGSVLVVDPDGACLRHASMPDMPQAFRDAVDGLPIDPTVGACGAAAATGRPYYAPDVTEDPNFAAFLGLAAEHGIAACWSFPILGSAGGVLGTFAFYSPTCGAPSPADVDLLQGAARLAAIALELDGSRRELILLADTDALTGLPNRALLLRRVQVRLDATGPGEAIAVLFCDLDRFKLINDTLGHAAGDAVLRGVAERLSHAVREGDLVARLGGDEFVVVPAEATDAGSARLLAERLRTALEMPLPDADGGLHAVRASVGIALVEGGTAMEAIRRADAAMYEAKTRRVDVAVHDASVDRRRALELRTVDALAGALERDELSLVFQPVVDLPGGHVRGFETLLRWHHPELGEVGPAQFVPVAEEHGLIAAIGRWVLREAVACAARWNAGDGRDVELSVNLSVVQLLDPGLADEVLGALADHGLDPALLRLEVTETAMLHGQDAAHATLRRLRAGGVAVDLDDFGTGPASLTQLRALPIDAIKVDRSFIAELGPAPTDGALVRGMVALAGGLELQVVAEGVETAEQAALLTGAGCGRAQGHHFGRPVPPAAVEAWLGPAGGPWPH